MRVGATSILLLVYLEPVQMRLEEKAGKRTNIVFVCVVDKMVYDHRK